MPSLNKRRNNTWPKRLHLRQQLLDDRQRFNQEMEHQRQAMLTEAEAGRRGSVATRPINGSAAQREHLSREALQLQQQQLDETRPSCGQRVAAGGRKTAPANQRAATGKRPGRVRLPAIGTVQLRWARENDRRIGRRAGRTDATENCTGGGRWNQPTARFNFESIEDLLGGLRIKTSRGVIDNSIVALSSFAEQNIRRQLDSSR